MPDLGTPAVTPDGLPPASLHRRILTEIEDRIVSGAWAPGARIPSEQELSATYGCSRMTVNKVLTQVAAAGLIERRRKTGSFVARRTSESAVLEITDVRAEVEALALPYRFEVLARRSRRSAGSDRERLALDRDGPVLDVRCRHFAGARPFCIEDRIINLLAVPDARTEPFADLSPGAWLLRRVPWSAAEHRVRAAGADAVAAAALGIDPGAPCLLVERRTWGAGQPVTFVRLTYPADAHEIVARFAPSRNEAR